MPLPAAPIKAGKAIGNARRFFNAKMSTAIRKGYLCRMNDNASLGASVRRRTRSTIGKRVE